MATISSQLRTLRKQIKIPHRIVFVDRVVNPSEFKEKVIYVHIWI